MNSIFLQKKSLELKKHVGTIHSNNKLTLIQRKIANALLYNAYDSLLTQDEHRIHISELCQLIGYDSKDFKKIKQALIALISTVIEWNLVDKETDKEGIWNASSIIADASIEGPICAYSYSNRMKQLLYRPEMYGRLNMQVQAKFKSSYGLALYENCIRFQNIAQTPWFEMQTFRKLMGVDDCTYVIFRDFKRRVLDMAVSEVNKHSPIYITTKFKKTNRQVVAIQFQIKKSEELEFNEVHIKSEQSIVDKLRENYGLSPSQFEKVMLTYGEDYIAEKIAIIESSSTFQNGKIANLAKYLEKALIQDYQPAKSSKQNVIVLQQQKESHEKQKKLHLQKIEQYRQYQDDLIAEMYKGLTPRRKTLLDKEFGEYVQYSMYYDIFLKEGLSNILAADKFCDFIRSHKKDILEQAMSFAEFCEQK